MGGDDDRAHGEDIVRATAIRWFMRNDDPNISAGEKAEFESWIAAAPEHAQTYDKLVALWHSDDFAQAIHITAPQHFSDTAAPQSDRFTPSGRKRGRVYKAVGLAVAACVTVFVALSDFGLQFGDKLRALTVDYATETAERKIVSLQDGARVTLNTASFMDVDRLAEGDRITLRSGEAFFFLTCRRIDPAVFFEVFTDQAEIRIRGTSFSVRNTASETIIGVRKGAVSVTPRSGVGNSVTLGAGDQLSVDKNGFGQIVALRAESLAWLEGRIRFHAMPLGEVVEELQRYHKGLILFADAEA